MTYECIFDLRLLPYNRIPVIPFNSPVHGELDRIWTKIAVSWELLLWKIIAPTNRQDFNVSIKIDQRKIPLSLLLVGESIF